MANAYTIKATPEATDSVTISDVSGQIFRATLGSLPGSSSAVGGYVDPPVYSDSSGIKGQYSFDAEYVYMCFADNSWDRFPVAWDEWGTAAPENPVILSATIDVSGEILTIVFDRNVFQGSAYLDSDFNLDASIGGSDIGITYQSGDGTRTHIYTIQTIIRGGETVDLDYNGRAEGLEDSSGNDLLSILSMSVTNSSEDLYSDIVLWDGFEGTIAGTAYEATNYDYPPFHTWADSSDTILLSSTIKRVGSKSLFLNSTATPNFHTDLPDSIPQTSVRFGMWFNYSVSGVGNILSIAESSSPSTNSLQLRGRGVDQVTIACILTGVTVVGTTNITTPNRTGQHFYEVALDLFTSTLKLFMDGVLIHSMAATGTPTQVFNRLLIGPIPGINTNTSHGYIDNLIVSTDPNRDLYALALLEAYPG